MNWPCAFCDDSFASVEGLAQHLLEKHSTNVCGFEDAPVVAGKRLWTEHVKTKCHCWCGKVFFFGKFVAPAFIPWLTKHSVYAEHLEKEGGIVAHIENIRLQHAMNKIDSLAHKRGPVQPRSDYKEP